MPLITKAFIQRVDLKSNPDHLFVFGDNIARVGYGGQAREMRGEANAIGLPTKRAPYIYLSNDDLDEVSKIILPDYIKLQDKIIQGGTVVWPLYDIGTGRAKLEEKAPKISLMYCMVFAHLTQLSELY